MPLNSYYSPLNEIQLEGVWVRFDGWGDDSEDSINFYKEIYEPIAYGALLTRHNGIEQGISNPNSIFYKMKKSAGLTPTYFSVVYEHEDEVFLT